MIIIQIKPLLILFSDLHVEGNLAVKVGQVIVHISVLSHLFCTFRFCCTFFAQFGFVAPFLHNSVLLHLFCTILDISNRFFVKI